MAKSAKKKEAAPKKKRGKYEPKQVVKGNFLEIIQAAVKDADKKKQKKEVKL